MPRTFDSKIFNSEVFQRYLERIPDTKRNELIKSGVLVEDDTFAQILPDQAGGNYIVIPYKGLASGDPDNYDGETDITASSSDTYKQGVIVIGRAKGFVEKDFSYDITGVDFMSNVASQVAKYWEDKNQALLLSILKGIFGIADLSTHIYNVGQAIGVTSLNTAIQAACGDNKGIFSLAIMHSHVSTQLENAQLLEYLKYTDANGVQRNLSLATWNGRMVIVDDDVPVEEHDAVTAVTAVTGVKAKYTLTISTNAVADDAIAITAGGTSATYICGIDWTAQTDAAGDCTELKTLIARDFPNYTVSKTASTVILTQKVALAETAATIVVNKKDTTGTLTATIAETTEGVTAVAAVAAADAYTEYTTYILGLGAFKFKNVGVKVPVEMSRDASKNGGEDTLYTRERLVFAPAGISFCGIDNLTSKSPTNAELENSANWELVKNAGGTATINHKAIPFVAIKSR